MNVKRLATDGKRLSVWARALVTAAARTSPRVGDALCVAHSLDDVGPNSLRDNETNEANTIRRKHKPVEDCETYRRRDAAQ